MSQPAIIRIEISTRAAGVGAALILLAWPAWVLAGGVSLPHSFQSGQTASASAVNANFAALTTAVNANDTRIGQLQGTALTASQLATLTGGGDASALHTHASLGGRPLKPRVAYFNPSVSQTLVDVSGRGVLLALRWLQGRHSDSVTVTIDGDASAVPFALNSSVANGPLGFFSVSGNLYQELPVGDGLPFHSSLKIDCAVPGGAANSTYAIVYALE